MRHLHAPITAVFFLVILTCSITFRVFGASEAEASAIMDGTEETIIQCYSAIAKADNVGANISTLLMTLQQAGELLSQASLSFNTGDFDSALDLASQSQELLKGFISDAEGLTDVTIQENYSGVVTTILTSTFGAIVVVVGSVILWFRTKKKIEEDGST